MPYADPKVRRERSRAYQAKIYRERRDTWLAENGPCKRCGRPEDLHIHHIDPSQKTTHRVFLLSEERRRKELAKCEVLCSGCHHLKHHRPEIYAQPCDYRAEVAYLAWLSGITSPIQSPTGVSQ